MQRWDIANSAPSFRQLLASGQVDIEDKKCLVPGCGRGYDVFNFAKAGAKLAVGVDLASTAVESAQKALDADNMPQEMKQKVQLLQSDFFTWNHPEGAFDVGYDYTLVHLDHSIILSYVQLYAQNTSTRPHLHCIGSRVEILSVLQPSHVIRVSINMYNRVQLSQDCMCRWKTARLLCKNVQGRRPALTSHLVDVLLQVWLCYAPRCEDPVG